MATPFTFLHAADLHLDTPFSGLARVADWLQPVLQEASLAAWERLVEAAVDERTTFVVLAGDVFDHTRPTLRAALHLADGIRRLGQAGITVFWAHGNHDPYESLEHTMARAVQWPTNLVRFPPGEAATVPVTVNGEVVCRVTGISYPRRVVQENYAGRLMAAAGGAPWGIAVLHGNIDGQAGHDNYAPASLADLRGSGFDYWALGHIHQRTILSQDPWVVYPGNLQGRHPKETGRKGAMRVAVDAEGRAAVTFLPLNRVRWEVVPVDVSSCEGWDEAVDAAAAALDQVALDPDEEGLLARVQLVGRSRLPARPSSDYAGLAERLSAERYAPGFVFVESVENRCEFAMAAAPPEGLWALVLEQLDRWDGDVAGLGGPFSTEASLAVDPEDVRGQARALLMRLLHEESATDAD